MLLLFDIDGTLLTSMRAGVTALTSAGKQVVCEAFTLEGLEIGGRLDPLIIAEALDAMGEGQHHARDIQRVYVEHLQALFDTSHRAQPLPGVQPLLEACGQRAGWTMGLLTGNFQTSARIKLSAAGIDPDQFEVCVWGDDGPSRNHLPDIAMQRCANKPPTQTVIIGDTLHDIACARACRCKAIAVATGVCTTAALACGQPDLLLDDLSDTGTVLTWLERMSA